MDRLSSNQRSELMRRVRGKNTRPEIVVRRCVRRLGYSFKVHDERLPGRPDIVFPVRRKAILVHGCFWHRHKHCAKATMPRSRVAFWRRKFDLNKKRDRRKLRELESKGWRVLVLWECEIVKHPNIGKQIVRFLERAR